MGNRKQPTPPPVGAIKPPPPPAPPAPCSVEDRAIEFAGPKVAALRGELEAAFSAQADALRKEFIGYTRATRIGHYTIIRGRS